MTTRALTVGPADHDSKLVDFVAHSQGCSLRKAKALLDERKVFVNRKRVWMARHRLRTGDEVEITDVFTPRSANRPGLQILYEDDRFLIVNKPPGLLSNGPDSLETLIREHRTEPALTSAHRLDRDTTGCLLMARNALAFDAAVHMFREGLVLKVYQAIVLGRPGEAQRTLTSRIDGDTAVTHWKVLSANEAAAHLQIKIDTGRTHQIRKHLSSIGHPVLGDSRYLTGRVDDQRIRAVPRQMLHAAVFQAPLVPKGKDVRVNAPLPEDFKKALKQFGLR